MCPSLRERYKITDPPSRPMMMTPRWAFLKNIRRPDKSFPRERSELRAIANSLPWMSEVFEGGSVIRHSAPLEGRDLRGQWTFYNPDVQICPGTTNHIVIRISSSRTTTPAVPRAPCAPP